MGTPTGITKILYDPSATTWAQRKFALYMHQVQLTELENFVATSTLKVRDFAAVTNTAQTRAIRARVRRRYPGGPAISVPAGNGVVVTGPPAKLSTWRGGSITI